MVTRRRLLKLWPALLPALPGCGYTLRGARTGRGRLSQLQLRMPDSEPALERILRRSLETAGYRLAPTSGAVLALGPERFSGRPASTGVQARAAQISLQLAVEVSLRDAENVLIDRETLSVSRTYYQDTRNIVGNRGEADLLREEMRFELIDRLMRRLETIER